MYLTILSGHMAPWPPDPQVITAAGGVGFGCLDLLNDDLGRGNGGMVDLRGDGDVRIPPVLRYLHPRLNGMGFARCRQDPLFLYKTVTVCEACFLVYAEFTTMYLQMGKGTHDHLKPEPGNELLLDTVSHQPSITFAVS